MTGKTEQGFRATEVRSTRLDRLDVSNIGRADNLQAVFRNDLVEMGKPVLIRRMGIEI